MRALLIVCCIGSASVSASPLSALVAPEVALKGTDGLSRSLKATVEKAPFTVLTFFSSDCPCQKAHDARLIALAQAYRERGVQFFVVDPEASSSLQRDEREAKVRAYPFPILRDETGKLAESMGVKFSTETVILDAHGRVHFRGGMDSAHRDVSPQTPFFLKDALDQLLGGHEPNPAEPKAMGCFLRGR
jgi:hypothetical protein